MPNLILNYLPICFPSPSKLQLVKIPARVVQANRFVSKLQGTVYYDDNTFV